VIPMLAEVRLGRRPRNPGDRRRKGLRIWVPLFLVWLLLLPFVVPLIGIGGLVWHVNPVRALSIVWQTLSAMRHVDIAVDSREAAVSIRLV
jgi:hypothetical protein